MSKGATEKQGWLSAVDGHWVADLIVQKEGLANVVQQHEENHQPAQGID